MHRRLACLLAVYCTGTHAQIEASAAPQQVVISGAQTDLEASQDFVAGKIIIGQKKIAGSGLQNTGELLRREPAISVDKSGRIGLLGLPGYTQVLVDGAPSSSWRRRTSTSAIRASTTAWSFSASRSSPFHVIFGVKSTQDLRGLLKPSVDLVCGAADSDRGDKSCRYGRDAAGE